MDGFERKDRGLNDIGIVQMRIQESIAIKQQLLEDSVLLARIEAAAELIQCSLRCGGKVLFCGNGGSAADSLHLTAEFMGKFQKERKALAAVSLNANISSITAIANDYSYDMVFARAVEALMKPEDVLVGISTSGNSENVYQAMLKAREIGGKTVSLLGKGGGKMKGVSDIPIIVPGDCTARVQEAHIMIGHIICEIAEDVNS